LAAKAAGAVACQAQHASRQTGHSYAPSGAEVRQNYQLAASYKLNSTNSGCLATVEPLPA